MTLEGFRRRSRFKTPDRELERLLKAVASFACDINATRPYWLSVIGESGIGKSHLAKAVYKTFVETTSFDLDYDPIDNRIFGNRGQFVDWRELCSTVRSGGGWGWVEDICTDDFAVLDDIGVEHDPSGFIASITDRIINARMGKWTFITCNLPLSEIASKLDVRIASRMVRDGNKVIESTAKDFSLRKI